MKAWDKMGYNYNYMFELTALNLVKKTHSRSHLEPILNHNGINQFWGFFLNFFFFKYT